MENTQEQITCVCEDAGLLNNRELLLGMLEKMMLVRKFEEKVLELFGKGMVHGTTHLGIGEEACGVGTTAALLPEDYMLATHRGHGASIGKGCDINAMMAEILAKEAGTCRGRGGSMHIADFDKGILGANGIVGANAALACGAALTIKKKGLNRVCLAFFGDGASNQGAVHESMNLASAWKLPVIFCLTNNRYAMSTPLENAMGNTDLASRGAAYGIKTLECDGNDVINTYETVKKSREYAVKHGPVFLVEHTYRTSGHSKSDANRYRSEEEISMWREHNPVRRFSNFLLEHKLFSEDDLRAADKKTGETVDSAVEYALSLDEPLPDTVLENVYADANGGLHE